MKPHWQQSHLDLYDIELEPAYYRALARSPDRLEDIKAVFDVTDALRVSLIRLDEIAFKNDSSFGAYCIEQIDNLHTDLWHVREFFDTLSHQSRALFTWREQPVEWRGIRASNIVELIHNEALEYYMILQKCSLRNTLAPSRQLRECYPEPWFDIEAVQDVARRIRERISPENKSSKMPAAEAAKTPATAIPDGNARNKSEQMEKDSPRDDTDKLALSEAERIGKTFPSAAAFCRAFLKDRPNCGAGQKALETMLGRYCDIWKKQT